MSYLVIKPYNRNLFRPYAVFTFLGNLALQGKDHIICSLKVAYILFPAHAAFTMLQSDKLLLHFVAAIRAYLIVFAHIYTVLTYRILWI